MPKCHWCDKEGIKFYKRTQHWCCCDDFHNCDGFKINKQNRNMLEELDEYQHESCSYCGEEAKYKIKNGKFCCEEYTAKCPSIREKNSKGTKGKPNVMKGLKFDGSTTEKLNDDNDLICEYGCGGKANFKLGNGKLCCSSRYCDCEERKEMVREKNRNNPLPGELNPMFGKIRTKEEREKISKSHIDRTGGYSKKNIPIYDTYAGRLLFAEECRRDPNDKNILQVRCAYCNNWFTPIIDRVTARISVINGEPRGRGENRFYCSRKCANECPIFNQKLYPKGFKKATSREAQSELRKLRFVIDNYTCQKCYKKQDELDVGLHCHHVEGVLYEAIESADLDKVITLCKTCHIQVHKIEGCRPVDMQCKPEDKYHG